MAKKPPQTTAIIYKEIKPKFKNGRFNYIVIPLHEAKEFEKTEKAKGYRFHGHTNAYSDIERLLNEHNYDQLRANLINMNDIPF